MRRLVPESTLLDARLADSDESTFRLVHDIRNHLAIATGTIYAFLDGLLEPGREQLLEIASSLHSIDELLRELRTASAARTEAGNHLDAPSP
jgi:hypothetical protein